MNKALIESLKEPLREMLMAVLPYIGYELEKINATWAVLLYLLIRAVDKYLHERKKADPTVRLKGLSPI